MYIVYYKAKVIKVLRDRGYRRVASMWNVIVYRRFEEKPLNGFLFQTSTYIYIQANANIERTYE